MKKMMFAVAFALFVSNGFAGGFLLFTQEEIDAALKVDPGVFIPAKELEGKVCTFVALKVEGTEGNGPAIQIVEPKEARKSSMLEVKFSSGAKAVNPASFDICLRTKTSCRAGLWEQVQNDIHAHAHGIPSVEADGVRMRLRALCGTYKVGIKVSDTSKNQSMVNATFDYTAK